MTDHIRYPLVTVREAVTKQPIADYLRSLDACDYAVAWAEPYGTDYARAWAECQRGDWMLWLAGKLAGAPGSAERRPLVLAACECARQALHRVPNGEDRPRIAIETVERWARGDGEVTLEGVRQAADAAADAADAAYAAYAAADAADAADAARSASLATSADIVRKHYPAPPVTP